jgi:hypothetical protein
MTTRTNQMLSYRYAHETLDASEFNRRKAAPVNHSNLLLNKVLQLRFILRYSLLRGLKRNVDGHVTSLVAMSYNVTFASRSSLRVFFGLLIR